MSLVLTAGDISSQFKTGMEQESVELVYSSGCYCRKYHQQTITRDKEQLLDVIRSSHTYLNSHDENHSFFYTVLYASVPQPLQGKEH